MSIMCRYDAWKTSEPPEWKCPECGKNEDDCECFQCERIEDVVTSKTSLPSV